MQDKISKRLAVHKGDLIAFVGAGGKTTSMYQAARELTDKGLSVLVTTTTKIYSPHYEDRKNISLYLGSADGLRPGQRKCKSDILVAASAELKGINKLIGYTAEEIDRIQSESAFEVVLVEADGAKEKPLKAPGENEPVVPETSTHLVGVIGLDCLGLSLDEQNVHRPEILADIAEQPINSPISEETLISLIVSPNGLFKGLKPGCKSVLLLNKADTPMLEQRGLSILQSLKMRFDTSEQPDLAFCFSFGSL